MDKKNLKKPSTCSGLSNYCAEKTPCSVCIELKELINTQNQLISGMKADQKALQEQLSKFQTTTEQQNKNIVEMLAEHKLQLQTLNKTHQTITTLTSRFPLKTEDDLQKVEAEICNDNEEKYVSTIKYLIDGNAMKNLERMFSRELCILYNADGICGKKSLKDYKKLYKIVIDAISTYSQNAEKEFRAALQVIKKRHFRNVCSQKKNKKDPI